MPSVTVDLPTDLLEDVSRLAQQLNIPRSDVYRLALTAYARSLQLEQEVTVAREALAAADRDHRVKDRLAGQARATIVGLSAELETVREERDRAVRTARGASATTVRLTRDLAAARGAALDAEQRRDEAERRAQDLEERDRQKVLAVLRDQEVATLRRRHQELGVVVQKLEQELVYQRMEADLKTKKMAGLERQLESAVKQRAEFETGFKREQQETFKSERQIGRLLQERARLRDELKRLAGLLRVPPSQTVGLLRVQPGVPPKAGAPVTTPGSGPRAGKVQSKA